MNGLRVRYSRSFSDPMVKDILFQKCSIIIGAFNSQQIIKACLCPKEKSFFQNFQRLKDAVRKQTNFYYESMNGPKSVQPEIQIENLFYLKYRIHNETAGVGGGD